MDFLPAAPRDLKKVLECYREARAFMATAGNPTQWQNGYPPSHLVEQDIRQGRCFLCMEDGRLLGVYTFFTGEDPTYGRIDGQWLRPGPYGVIHRVAVTAPGRGVAGRIFSHCFGLCGNLRIDTHRDNLPMQRALEKAGFQPCGTIWLEDGQTRLAYQKVK